MATEGRSLTPHELRSLAVALAYAVTFKWLLARVAMLAVHVADVLARLLRGPTAVLVPSRTGGGDHSARAVITGRSPMCKLGGGFTDGSECVLRPRWRVAITRTVLTANGWESFRRWRVASSPANLCDDFRVVRRLRA